LFAAEIISFINHKHPLFHKERINRPRKSGDTKKLERLKGKKFDLSESIKKEIHNKYHEDICWLKNHWNIDYSSPIQKMTDTTRVDISSKQLTQLKKEYSASSPHIQQLIREYLDNLPHGTINITTNKYHEFKQSLKSIRESRLRITEIKNITGIFLRKCKNILLRK